MTLVSIDLQLPDDGDTRPAEGTLEFRPTARFVKDDAIVLPAPFYVNISDMPVIVGLEPTDPERWCWRIIERVKGGLVRHVFVPDTSDVIQYVDLVDVDPKTLDPTEPPSPAWVEQLANYITPDPSNPGFFQIGA